MAKKLFRKTSGAPGLLRIARDCFDRVPDPVAGRGPALPDCLMSALAMFGLKYASLLQFDRDARRDERVRSNLRKLYGVARAPSDTAMRERLDGVDPAALRGAFKRLFAALQRGKALADFTWLGHHVLSVDGTGFHSSERVRCAHCCEKRRRDGTVTYHHQMLGRCWCTRNAARCSRWRRSRSCGRTVPARTTASATPRGGCWPMCGGSTRI